MLAALVALVCVLLMAFVIRAPDPSVILQSTIPAGPDSEFNRPINEYPASALQFFAADSLFVLSYLIVFVGLYTTVRERSRPFALIGLGAGILTALFDATENAYVITYVRLALNAVPLNELDLPLVYIIANLKWMAAFATLYAFGLVWPRDDRSGWILSAVMLLFPLVGVLGVAVPGLVLVRGLFFLVGMPLFA